MRLLILSNREPLRREDGEWAVSVGGLTTALMPVLERRGGVWIAWGEDAAAEDGTPDVVRYPAEDPRFEVRRIALSESEITNYYYGLSNRVLWPICHYFVEQMDLQRHFYLDYSHVNWRFAEEAARAYEPGDVIWVQDYHLMLVPGLLRKARPDAKIGFFFHIPWPAVEVWRVLPWAQQLVEGLLGADLVGFHTEEYAQNFIDAAKVLLNVEAHGNVIHWNGREIRVEAHPIGIDTGHFSELAASAAARAEAERIRAESGGDCILVGIDRLDYTKGVLERLLAFERFLEDNPEYASRVTFYQIAAPSRTRVESYQELKRAVDEVAGRINGAYMREGWVPVRYFYRSMPQDELIGLYLAADAALITPLRDGMNVVAQEFSWATERGMLILSNLTGASAVLSGMLSVNPYDVEGLARTIKLALDMDVATRSERMAGVKRQIEHLDVHRWADRFLDSLDSA